MNLIARLPHCFGRTALASAVAIGFMMFGAAPNLRADRYEECHRRIAKADQRRIIRISAPSSVAPTLCASRVRGSFLEILQEGSAFADLPVGASFFSVRT